MIQVLKKKVGIHRGKFRLFFEGQYLKNAGFTGGQLFDVEKDVENRKIVLFISETGKLKTTNSTKNGQVRPVIDFKDDSLSMFDEQCKVIVQKGKVIIVRMHTEEELEERESRTIEHVKSGDCRTINVDLNNLNVEFKGDFIFKPWSSIFDLQKDSVTAEAVNVSGDLLPNRYFYAIQALIKTAQPGIVSLKNLIYKSRPDTPAKKQEKEIVSLMAATTLALNNMGYVSSADDRDVFLSKGLIEATGILDGVTSSGALQTVCLKERIESFRNAQITERIDRLKDKFSKGSKLAVSGLFHGLGVLCAAVSKGLSIAGVNHYHNAVVEMSETYLNASLSNNDIVWSPSIKEQQFAICMPIQEVKLNAGGLKSEISTGGIPCEGASKSGISRNKIGSAEEHKSVGACFVDWLHWQNVSNPVFSLIENVKPYSTTLGFAIIVDSIKAFMGYEIEVEILYGSDYKAIENRERMSAIAFCPKSVGVKSLSGFQPNVVNPTYHAKCVGDILEENPSSEFSEYKYLKDKEVRDIAAGKGFRLQWVGEDATSVGCIGKSYQKARSTEPFLKHPNLDLARLFTTVEHARLKQIPERFISGIGKTIAHEMLGQSVVFTAFLSEGQKIGRAVRHAASHLMTLASRKYPQVA